MPTHLLPRRPAVARRSRLYRLQLEVLEPRCCPSTVANLLDSGPGSLRQAILDTPAGGTVGFQPGLTGTIALTSGELELHSSVTIQGPGAATLAVSGGGLSRVFEVFGGATVVLADLTITHGQVSATGTGIVSALGGAISVDTGATLTARGDVLSNNLAQAIAMGGTFPTATAEGGAIYCAGALTLTSCTFTGNTASASGSGFGNAYGYGGAVYDNASGTLTVTGCTFSGNSAMANGSGQGSITSAGGGAIYNDSGTLALSGCTVSGNSATGTSVPTGTANGGGLYSAGPLTMIGSLVSNNAVSGGGPGGGGCAGGGLYSAGPLSLTLTSSTISGNRASAPAEATAQGAGVYGGGTFTGCTISGNSLDGFAGFGAGIYGGGTFTGCTISGNTAQAGAPEGGGAGGGVFSAGPLTVSGCTISGNSIIGHNRGGGGIFNAGTLTVSNSTLSNNAAPASNGGGIANVGTLSVGSSTLNGNSAGVGGGLSGGGTLKDTIVAGNQASISPDVAGTLTSQGHNLIGDGTGGTGYDPTDLVGTAASPIDPRLGLLQDNGGPTQTLALLAGSPAIAAGDPTGAPASDQRGFARVVGGTIDIGAFELQPAGRATRLTLQASAPIRAGTPFAIKVIVGDDFGQPAAGYTGTVHFTLTPAGTTANYTFMAADAGLHTFAGLVLTQAATDTVTGADTANPSITGRVTFTVTPANPDHLSFSVPPPVTAGVPFAITVTVQDMYGNTVTGYVGTVHFKAYRGTDLITTQDYTFTAADAGQHTFAGLVLYQAAGYTITGIDEADPDLNGSITFTVAPAG
jgi:hypothetical protein